jgi:peptidoglycan/LPS O-acetylase OafA/YrhL
MGIAFLWVGHKMLNSSAKLAAVLSSFGTASFGVYLIHPALLTLWRVNYTYPSNTWAYHASTIGAFLMICTVPWLLVFVVKKWNYSWIFLGR